MSKLEKLQPDATVKYISANSRRRKLPGKGFRILSFMPAFNWISLLYLGLINSSTLNVMCAIAYAVITFTNTSLSALIWILGIVHYDIAYRNVKTQIIGDSVKSTTQTKTTPIQNSTSVSNGFSDIVVPEEQELKQSISVMPSSVLEGVRGDFSPKSTSTASEFPNVVASKEQEYKNRFSDIVVPGEQESKQSLPVKPSYVSEDVSVFVSENTAVSNGFSDIVVSGEQEEKQSIPVKPSYVSENVSVSISLENSSYTKFFTDMKRNALREEKTAAFVPFKTYYPTYDSMNKDQQAWYFYWRSQIRQGNYMDTDVSYIFVLVYELLSGIGWQDPQEGHQKFIQLWAAYRKKSSSLEYYLRRWTFDFTQQYNLEYSFSGVDDHSILYPSSMTDILISRHAEDMPLKLPFSLINNLCDYPLVNSKFYKDGNQDLMHEAIPRVITLADSALRKNKQKGILDTYGPPGIEKQEYYAFTSAVCPYANKKTYATAKDYSTYPKLRVYINELVRYSENTLRELRGCKGRLRGVTIDEETAKLVKKFLKKQYGLQATQENEPLKEPKVLLDVEKIKKLRLDSDAVRTALEVKETTIPDKKALLTDVQEVTAIYTAISPSARNLLDRLEKSSWECSATQGDETLIAEINRLAERYLGCSLLVAEASKIIAEDDYQDELEYIYKNKTATLSEGNGSRLFDSSVLKPEMKEFVDSLLPVQQKSLYVLITSEKPQSDLETIADEALTMPQLLLDDINELALQIIGEIIVDTADQKPQILDEYIDLLKQSVAREKIKCSL
ncbi:MAG: TerB N-terminal domain-containing protein [Methanomethylovorans sp.]|uniref:TerB N-terminal domain-containing protein n=1 Tax=Methanomethylovorans sp. TaxID=2758717 RepID=UPI00353060DD